MQPQEKLSTPNQKHERAPYQTPKLIRYGQVASLTQSGGAPSGIEDVSFTLLSIP